MKPPLSPPVFVVGTGRCGSTMLSSFLREHPHILSISEFFSLTTDLGGRIAASFPEGSIGAGSFWQIIASAHPKLTAMLRHGVAMDEVLYRPGPGTRFSKESGVPALMQTTLPHLLPEHDAFFDEVQAFVAMQPEAPVSAHYARLFGWLVDRLGKRTWVERSGGSLRIARRLVRAFPGAKFVHLVRDGRNCAISMSRHFGFRMAFLAMQLTEILGVDPFESADRTWAADVPDELCPFLPERFDGEAFRSYEIPLALCGHYWSGEIMTGLEELSVLPADRLLTLRYEDFLSTPRESIAQLARYIGPEYVDDDWTERAAAAVRPARSAWRELPEREMEELQDACRPGFVALGNLYPEPRGTCGGISR